MLKVWRGKNTIYAECTVCGSYGTASHLQPALRLEPEIAEALERHTAHMMTLREFFQQAAQGIAAKVNAKELSTADAAKKINELTGNHVAQVHLAAARLPNPEGKVTEYVTECPWCKVAETVDIMTLPDDASEPPFSLVKLVAVKQKGE